MAQTIHDLFREIDKALEQVRALGARDEHLSLKLPRRALPDFRQLCGNNDPGVMAMAPASYCGIPITEWTDGPFMSFSLDHKVIFDPTMPTTFYGKGVHDMVVELRNAPAKVDLTPRFAPPCPECGLRDGRHLACRTGEALDCIFRADIAGDIERIQATPIAGRLPRIPTGRIGRIIRARRKRFKAKPFTTEHDEGVHRAISAMQRPGRANEL